MTRSRHRPPRLRSTAHGTVLRALTAAGLLSAFLLVVLGDTVRVTESGMGCRSWPLCNGQAGLAGTYHATLEQLHRYLAAAVTLLIAAAFAMAWRRAHRDRLVRRSAAAALGLVGVQVLLGAVTVFTHNADWTVSLHLAGAWLLVAAVTVTALAVWRAPPTAPSRLGHQAAPAGRLGLAAAAALFALSVSGMLVLHEGASNACPGWPACGWGGSPAGLVALQYLHRSLALAVGVLVVAAAVRAWRSAAAGLADRMLAAAAVALLAGTAAFGALVATTGAPPVWQDLHLAVASALWVVVVALATPRASREGVAPGTARAASHASAPD